MKREKTGMDRKRQKKQRDGLEKRQGDGQNLDRYLDKKWTGNI